MPDVQLDRKLMIPADAAAEALGDLLGAIAAQKGPWRGFALHVSLGDLHLPDVGYVAIPIRLTVEKDPSRERSFRMGFTSASLPAAFPEFKGTISVEPGSIGESSLHLDGSYELPMQLVGRLVDIAFTPGVARRSLENFIGEVAEACEARVNEREAEFARYHFYAQTLR